MSWRRIGVNSAYIAAATAALALLQWAIMAIIARLDGPGALGEYALALALATPASYLAWLSMRQQLLVSRSGETPYADFVFLRILVPALVFLALFAVVAAVYDAWTLILVCAGVFALKYVEGFFDLAYGRLQQSGDVAGLARTTLSRCAASIVVFVCAYAVARDLPVALLVLALSWVVIFAFQRRRFGPYPPLSDVLGLSRPTLRRRTFLAAALVPFALSNVVMSLTTNAPRLLIEHELGPVELGLFAAVFHFITVGAVAAGSIGHAILPGLASAVREGDERSFWRQLAWPMVVLQTGCGIAVWLAAEIGSGLVEAVYGRAFAGQGSLLVLAAVAAGPVYCAALAANGCYAAQLRRALLSIQCLALTTVVVATLVLVPIYGAAGAMAGALLAGLVQFSACIGVLVWFWRGQAGAPLYVVTAGETPGAPGG